MQFAYQYPERTERLLLVDPGGLGPEVTVLIRALSLPGYDLALRMMTLPLVRQANTTGLRLLKALRLRHTHDLDEVARILDCLGDRATRYATHQLVTGVVDWRGQIVTMRDRAYLTEAMPMCVVWGADDKVIPASHAMEVSALAPEARVVVMADAGHFPHKDHADAFAELVDGFIADTAPATYSRARMRRLLKAGGPPHLEPVASELA
jgi:pimeloyl-ACP methyl ester carboxylesterase